MSSDLTKIEYRLKELSLRREIIEVALQFQEICGRWNALRGQVPAGCISIGEIYPGQLLAQIVGYLDRQATLDSGVFRKSDNQYGITIPKKELLTAKMVGRNYVRRKERIR